jgi:hypothetical protein
MPVQSEQNYLGDWLKYEDESLYSRDEAVVVSGQNLATGTVVGIITASGKVTQLAPAASDGSQNAAGVLLLTRAASSSRATPSARIRSSSGRAESPRPRRPRPSAN